MEALVNDIQRINREFFRLALQPDLSTRVMRLLSASDAVANRIRGSTEEGQQTAIKCRMPLVTLTGELEDLITSHPHDWPAQRIGKEIPPQLQLFTRFVLEVAWGLSRLDLTAPETQFGLSRQAVADLRRCGAGDLIAIAERPTVFLRVRAANQPLLWDRLMIGSRCEGPRATRIAREIALMSLGLYSNEGKPTC